MKGGLTFDVLVPDQPLIQHVLFLTVATLLLLLLARIHLLKLGFIPKSNKKMATGREGLKGRPRKLAPGPPLQKRYFIPQVPLVSDVNSSGQSGDTGQSGVVGMGLDQA